MKYTYYKYNRLPLDHKGTCIYTRVLPNNTYERRSEDSRDSHWHKSIRPTEPFSKLCIRLHNKYSPEDRGLVKLTEDEWLLEMI